MVDSTTSMSSGSDSTSSAPAETSPSPAASSTSTPDTRSGGMSLDDAFASVGLTGSPEAPDDTIEAQTTPVPATAAPAAPTDDQALSPAPSEQGPIPAERHKAILENTRRKTAEDVVARVESQFGPAIQFQSRLHADPVGTISQLITEAVNDPGMGQQIVSQLARALGARRGQARTNEEPQADLETEDGSLVYSADQHAKREAWLRQQIAEETAQRLAPLEQDRQERAKEAATLRAQQETRQTVTSRLKAWEGRPGFSEHKQAIAQIQQSYVDSGMDTWSALGLAYADVYADKVLPKLQADTQNKFVSTAVAKARASTDNPSAVGPSTKPRPKSLDEAFAQFGLTG